MQMLICCNIFDAAPFKKGEFKTYCGNSSPSWEKGGMVLRAAQRAIKGKTGTCRQAGVRYAGGALIKICRRALIKAMAFMPAEVK